MDSNKVGCHLRFRILPLCFAGFLAFAASADGGGSDYKLTISDGVAALGDTAEVAISLDSGDGDPIVGYSFGVCHDALVDIASGDIVNGSALSGHIILFQSIFHYADGWTLGCVFDPQFSDQLDPANNQELYLASYEAVFEGTSNITFCELGNPPVPLTIAYHGTDGFDHETIPDTKNGTIESGGDPPFVLRAAAVVGSQASQVEVPITLDAPREADAVTFGLSHTSSLLMLDSISEGADIGGLNGGDGPAYFYTNLDPAGSLSGGTVACVASLSSPLDKFPIGDAQEIAVFTYTVSPGADDQSVSALDFTGSLGSPPVRIVVSVDGFSETPVRDAGEVLIKGNPIPVFIRGDANADGNVNISDPLFLALFLFKTGATPDCSEAADVNNDNNLTVGDPIALLSYLFEGGSAPASPFPSCGDDPDAADDTVCETTHKPLCD